MPELPELEVVKDVLRRRIVGQSLEEVEVRPPGGPIVIRDMTGRGFREALTGQTISAVDRRGKFVRFGFEAAPSLYLVINPKLTGRLQLAEVTSKLLPKTQIVFALSSGKQLRYIDQKVMGQLYLTEKLEAVPGYAGLGPEALDVSLDEFKRRLRPFRGEIKGVLTRGEFVAGIGNAYADEILWAAQIYPFRKRTQLSEEEVNRLYEAMRATLLNGIEQVRILMGENIHEEPRQFMAVHMKTGEPCPRCGRTISLIGANERITNFCRYCQPGSLIRGF